jgi:hypothetical protein
MCNIAKVKIVVEDEQWILRLDAETDTWSESDLDVGVVVPYPTSF